MEAVLEKLKEDEKADDAKSTDAKETTSKKASKWDKAAAGFNASTQALGSAGQIANMFQQQANNNVANNNSGLRKPTAYDNMVLNNAIGSYEEFIKNGWGNEISFNGSSFFNSKTGEITALDGTVTKVQPTGTDSNGGNTAAVGSAAEASNPFVLKKKV